MSAVIFAKGVLANYTSLATKSEDTLYFTTDTHQIFMGSEEYTKSTKTLNAEPTSSTAGDIGRLYAYNGNLYLCSAVSGNEYTWIRVANVNDVVGVTYSIGSTAEGQVTLTPSIGSAETITINGWDTLAKKSDITAVLRFKGVVATASALPAEAVVGDTYVVSEDNSEYTCITASTETTDAVYEKLGPVIDLSAYALSADVIQRVTGEDGEVPKFKADGTLESTGFTLGCSVPADAEFTDTTYDLATASADGLMSSTDFSKLAGIEAGAQVNTVTGIKGDAESDYRDGNVNITAANLGITMPVADINAISTTYATKQELTAATSWTTF